MIWAPEEVTRSLGGFFRIKMTRLGGVPTDVTFFRGAPAKLQNYSFSDPFSDSTAQISFPQITPFDDFSRRSEVGSWLSDFSQVDIYWVPVFTDEDPGVNYIVNPLTDEIGGMQEGRKITFGHQPRKVWEGFVANMDLSDPSSGVNISCQGALFQLDGYLAKPMYPPGPWPMEKLIQYYMKRETFPHLRTSALKMIWPTGWTKVAPAATPVNQYTLQRIKKGQKYTGFATRSTGAWDRVLTGFVQDQIAVMWTLEDSGVEPGNQWTVLKNMGRQPIMIVRDRHRTPDFTLWFGSPGVTMRLSRDTTQVANIVYGEGVGTDGSGWSNAQVTNDGSSTSYLPLAHLDNVYPAVNNPRFDPQQWAKEQMYKYGSGFGMDDAIASAGKSLRRDFDAGWNGDLTIMIDPTQELTRWEIKAGMTVKIKGIVGSGEDGLNFHIASVDVNPQEGSVAMKIDTRYRDLLNLEEAQARTRDPLTPAKMLQVHRKSVLIDDIVAPWNYSAGSGFIPKASVKFHQNRPETTNFPWESWAQQNPPRSHASYYARVNANAQSSKGRWTFLTPNSVGGVLMSQKGQIRRTEFAAFDRDGNIKKVRFHVGIYYVNHLDLTFMPHEGSNYDPFQDGFFETIGDDGLPKGPSDFSKPDDSLIIGWGNSEQPAGYSPGRFSDGAHATGLLVDEAPWQWDFSGKSADFPAQTGKNDVPQTTIMLSVAIYCHTNEDVFFLGRLYRSEPGS